MYGDQNQEECLAEFHGKTRDLHRSMYHDKRCDRIRDSDHDGNLQRMYLCSGQNHETKQNHTDDEGSARAVERNG